MPETTKTSFSYQGEPRWTTSGWPASKLANITTNSNPTIFTKSSYHKIPSPTILDSKFPKPPKFANPKTEREQIIEL